MMMLAHGGRCRSLMLAALAMMALMAVGTAGLGFGYEDEGLRAPSWHGHHEKELMSSVTALTFYKDQMTTGRRSPPVKQMQCLGYCPAGVEPDAIQCVVTGHGARGEPQWKCEADLGEFYKLAGVEVVCEGYDYPDDPYILSGSCGLEYKVQPRKGRSSRNPEWSEKYDGDVPTFASKLGTVFIMGIVIWILYSLCIGAARRTVAGGNPNGGGYGGPYGGGGGGPYYGGGGPYYGGGCGAVPGAGMGTGGPGFWSGMAAGGTMGYMAGRHSTPSYSGGSFSSSSSSSFGGSSTSTGFGGTRRR